MIVNLNDIEIPFSDYYISQEDLKSYIERLRRLTPYAEDDYVDIDGTKYEDARVFLLPKLSDKIVFMCVSLQIVDVPQFYILTDTGDYKLGFEEGMDLLAQIVEKHPSITFLKEQMPFDDVVREYLQLMVRKELGSEDIETPYVVLETPADEKLVEYYSSEILQKVYNIQKNL